MMMMRMRTKPTELTSMNGSSTSDDLEVRPGGMLVQKRDPDDSQTRSPPPTIRVRVKYGSTYHEIIISSTATFGELKRLLTGPTGLHYEDQKLIYKDKERLSKSFLDVVGVKDKSKLVLLEDPVGREKRLMEARKNAKFEKASKMLSGIRLEVDRLAGQVVAVESVVSEGGEVAEETVAGLIELLMNQVLKLDEVKVDGDLNQQKKIQVKRVQRCVEKLDVLKIKQSPLHGRRSPPIAAAAPQTSSKNASGVVVTTKWETFDSLPTIFPAPPSTSKTGGTIQQNFNWDLLLK
ncbi:hypothetical protein SSX86_020357 [Deinandra increscens subsp. villosa]|uniref:BAG family molecular chaperone regulator 1 n=1 Tax=Deinandra increscens subsp. villosa TaxID=3103831 RepID=A0AAP0GQS1_9ASTR